MTRTEVKNKYRAIRRRLKKAKTATDKLAVEHELTVLQRTCKHPETVVHEFDEELCLYPYGSCPDCHSDDC